MKRFSKYLAAAAMLCGLTGVANAATIFFADASGKVGAYDTTTSTQSTVGDLSAFSINQVIGIAYDGATDSIYLLDRNANKVYAMNASTGAASLAFSTGNSVFQGGAVKGTTLFGVNENTQGLNAFTLGGTDTGLAGPNIDHTHALGINAATGQLYAGRSGSIYEISDTGVIGTSVFTSGSFLEDVDYLDGNFVYVDYGNQILSSGGTFTGATISGFSSLSGVAVRQFANNNAVPEPATWGMMLVGFGLVGASLRRRHQTVSALA
jgi:PEP-CTERM motif